MGVGILAKRVVLELGSSTNFVYSLSLSFYEGLSSFERDCIMTNHFFC